MKVVVERSWSFEQALAAAWRAYPGGNIGSKGYRNGVLRTWANVVGRRRAVDGLRAFVGQHGSLAAAARALGLAPSTLGALRRHFREVPEAVDEPREGLVLWFATPLSRFDRYLVDGVVFGVLGPETGCRLVDLHERDGATVVRLAGARREELEAVGDALWERVWEERQRTRATALALAEQFASGLRPALTDLRERLERMELAVLAEEVREMLADRAAAHREAKDRRTVRTPGQTVAHILWEKGKKRLVGELEGLRPPVDEG